MDQKFKSGDAVKVLLTAKHTLPETSPVLTGANEVVEHTANFLRYLPPHNGEEWAEVVLDRHHSVDAGGKLHRLSVPLSQVIAALLLLFLFIVPARADVQYTTPQTVQATLATGAACTGASQNFTTGVTPLFDNLGQTIHTAIATPAAGITSMSVQVFGIDNAGNVMAISDQSFSPTGTSAIATASGYFPNIRIVVVCNTGGTFNLTYSGASSTPWVNVGTSLQNQVTKVLGQAISSASAATLSVGTTPFANSSGMLYYTTVSAAGGAPTLAVSCSGSTVLPSFSTTFSPASAALTVQTFPLPASPCFSLTIVYTPNGAAGAANLSIGVSFNAPGLNVYSADPCQDPLITKLSAPVTAPAATTTQIVAGVTGQQIYACGYNIGVVVAVSGTVQWTTGTGGTCAANTVTKTGAIPINTAEPFSYGPGSTLFTAAPGSGVCVTLTGAGDNAAGILTYVLR
jgi:hypothetical protein